MDSANSIPDSTDWLNTPLHLFADLENALHCQICKEFYDTPMLTSCSHTFCSKCIRTSLSADGKCPACRTADQASKLRNNWALQEVVSAFLVARPAALAVAKREQAQEAGKRPGKRKRAGGEAVDGLEEEEGRTTRSKSRRIAASQASEVSEVVEIEDDVEDDGVDKSEPQTKVDDGLVECPLGCGKRMKIEQVDPHLDRCEEERAQEELKSRPKPPVNMGGGSRSSGARSKNARPQDRLSELNYSMLRDTAMRKKLDDLGLPAWGTKQLMVRRHIEWVNLWNANCDSDHPRTKRELLHELDIWERTQGGRAPNAQNTTVNGIMRKDFDAAGWASKNRDEFSRLIADARRKKNNPAVTETPSKDESTKHATQPTMEEIPKTNSASAPPSSQAHSTSQHSPSSAPYAEHPEALAGVRAKVEALNGGEHVAPKLNEDFRGHPSVSSIPPAESSAEQASQDADATDLHSHLRQSSFARVRESSQDEHTVARNTGSPCDIPSHLRSPVKKVPMFSVPAEMISDIDGTSGGGEGGGGGGGGHG